MILHILRALFVLLMAAVGWSFIKDPNTPFGAYTWLALAIALVVGVFIVCIDILAPRKKLAVFSGTFFGLLVGIVDRLRAELRRRRCSSTSTSRHDQPRRSAERQTARRDHRATSTCSSAWSRCYLAISFILQTKDDFRFIIPYVEFSKQTKGARPILLDTSVLIDGRITDIADTGIIESQLIVPRFVLDELQTIADSADKLKRNRGRRGLDVLAEAAGATSASTSSIYDSLRPRGRQRRPASTSS